MYHVLPLQGITTVLEFPLSLTISVPAQIPNWAIVADLTSTLSRIKRSPLQVVGLDQVLEVFRPLGYYKTHP